MKQASLPFWSWGFIIATETMRKTVTVAIPTRKRCEQEDQKFEASLDYTASLRQAWATY